MKFLLFSVFATLFLMSFTEASVPSIDLEGPVLHRFRRFTCDALSFEAGTIKVNHAACAIHCVALGKRGGYCNSQAVCVCRK